MLCGVWLVFVIWQTSLCLFNVIRGVGVVSSVENCKWPQARKGGRILW